MTQYVKKISETQVEFLTSVPNVWNPRPDTIKAYADANGWKKFNVGNPDNYLCTEITYRETSKNVYQEFSAPSMDICRNRVAQLIKEDAARVLASRRIVTYDGNKYILDTQASLNLLGIKGLGAPDVLWTLEDDSQVTLDEAGMNGLAAAFAVATNSVYEWKTAQIELAKACESVEELAAIVTTYPDGGDS